MGSGRWRRLQLALRTDVSWQRQARWQTLEHVAGSVHVSKNHGRKCELIGSAFFTVGVAIHILLVSAEWT